MSDTTALKVITPSGTALETQVAYAVFPGQEGQIGVLPNHSATLAELAPGVIACRAKDDSESYYFVARGYLHIRPEEILMLTPFIESSDQIDKARAEAARDRAKERLNAKDPEIDKTRARKALLRAEARLYLLSL